MSKGYSFIFMCLYFLCYLMQLQGNSHTSFTAKSLTLHLKEDDLSEYFSFLHQEHEQITLAIGKEKHIVKLSLSKSYYLDALLMPHETQQESSLFLIQPQQVNSQELNLHLRVLDPYNIQPKSLTIRLSLNDSLLKELENCWEIGPYRVTPQLLWKQQFRWEGKDLLLYYHSKDHPEHEKFVQGKHAFFSLKPQDSLYWNSEKWCLEKYPSSTLTLQNLSEKQATLTLNDPLKIFSQSYTLSKTPSEWYPYKEIDLITFLQQKDKDTYKVAFGKNILLLRKKDWIISKDENTIEAIDSKFKLEKLLKHEFEGTLMIVNGMSNQQLEIELYSQARTKAYKVRFPQVPQGQKSYEHYPTIEELK